MNCESVNLTRFFDLGSQPNGNQFPSAIETESEVKFPFAMLVCTNCWQVQIEEFPSTEFMFSNHPYITGVNMPVLKHFDAMVEKTIRKFDIAKNSLVIDIGANDGSLLLKFQDAGMRVLGIDPNSRTAKIARNNGITVCESFWEENTAEALGKLNLNPELITATAVFYHVADLHSFVKGLSFLMNKNTIFLAQCVYLKDVIAKLQFDHFYHEHTMIHAIMPLKQLFARYDLRMIDVDFYDVHGGSFVLYVAKEDSEHKTQESINIAIETEKSFGLNKIQTYHEFSDKVEYNKNELLNLLESLATEGKSVYALGAPLKGSTLLNYCGIGPNLVKYATEVNPFKIGRYTPGTHIPIVYEESVTEQPDYYLLLSWNFFDYFVEKYTPYLKNGGKFIVPHPVVKVFDSKSLGI